MMRSIALSALLISGAVVTAAVMVTVAFAQEKVKCPKCGTMNTKFMPDGKTERTACEKCGYSVKVFAADKGPDKIDKKVLDDYPKEMQDTYSKLFSKRCSKCHTLARPINTDNPPTKWEEYVKKMMKKPGSGIKAAEAKKIWQFLVFDTVKRKGKELEKVLEKLPKEQRQKEMDIAQRVVEEVEKESQKGK